MVESAKKQQRKRRTLQWFDILFLTVILWGEGIYSSTLAYLFLLQGETTIDDNLTFTAADDYWALAVQFVLLLAALVYLKLRNFDFRTWHIRFSVKAVLWGGVLFLAAALLMDVYTMATAGIAGRLPFPSPVSAFLLNTQVSSVIYALFNGFYEELYFLGICLAVAPRQRKWAVLFSLLVRVSFHTYQGMSSAVGIGIVFGLFMYLMYRRSKTKNLLPFFIAHAIADIFGLGILWMFGINL